jgi:hypothetical protein
MKKLFNKKGGAMDGMIGIFIALAVIAIVMTVAFLMISQAKKQIGTTEGFDSTNGTRCRQSAACNATSTVQNAMSGVPSWIPIIVVVAIGAVLLGLVMGFAKMKHGDY